MEMSVGMIATGVVAGAVGVFTNGVAANMAGTDGENRFDDKGFTVWHSYSPAEQRQHDHLQYAIGGATLGVGAVAGLGWLATRGASGGVAQSLHGYATALACAAGGGLLGGELLGQYFLSHPE